MRDTSWNTKRVCVLSELQSPHLENVQSLTLCSTFTIYKNSVIRAEKKRFCFNCWKKANYLISCGLRLSKMFKAFRVQETRESKYAQLRNNKMSLITILIE